MHADDVETSDVEHDPRLLNPATVTADAENAAPISGTEQTSAVIIRRMDILNSKTRYKHEHGVSDARQVGHNYDRVNFSFALKRTARCLALIGAGQDRIKWQNSQVVVTGFRDHDLIFQFDRKITALGRN